MTLVARAAGCVGVLLLRMMQAMTIQMVGMITNSTKHETDTPTAIATVSTPVSTPRKRKHIQSRTCHH